MTKELGHNKLNDIINNDESENDISSSSSSHDR